MFTPGDRRDLLKQAADQWLGSLMEQAEERIIRRRFVRPPGALPEVAFLAACTRCNACVDVCPPRAIRTAPSSEGFAAGTPHLEVELQPCIACPEMPCAAPHMAMDPQRVEQKVLAPADPTPAPIPDLPHAVR